MHLASAAADYHTMSQTFTVLSFQGVCADGKHGILLDLPKLIVEFVKFVKPVRISQAFVQLFDIISRAKRSLTDFYSC